MREVLEDAAIVYRYEAESLLMIAGPAVVLGPLCVLLASSGLGAALLSIPLLMTVYLLTYAVSLHAAHLAFGSEAPDPARALFGTLHQLPSVTIAAGPIALGMAAALTSSLDVSDQGFSAMAFGIAVLGAAVAVVWMARHIYDLPLIMAYDVSGLKALRAGRSVADTAPAWTARVFFATVLPLVISWLICWGLWAAISPAFGASVFAALAAVWLPFAALSFVNACTRLVSEQPAEPSLEPIAP